MPRRRRCRRPTSIKDCDTQRFMADVIEASRKRAGARRFLGALVRALQAADAAPRKDRAARPTARCRLVKINIDENQQLAAQMRIQSIPAVFAFVDGQPVDGFMGALPESQIKQFIDRLGGQGSIAEEIEAAVGEGRDGALARRITPTAAQIFAPGAAGRSRTCRRHRRPRQDARSRPASSTKAKATLALVPPAKASDPEVVARQGGARTGRDAGR